MDVTVTETPRAAAELSLAFAASRDFTGADPYDGLLSPVSTVLRSRLPRQAWVQLVKRRGENFRRAVRIQPVQMSKSLALFSMAAHELGDIELSNAIATSLLKATQGGPWGYEFDVQTRWAHYPAGSPNVIATAFAVRALDLLQRTSEISDRTMEWLLSLRQPEGHFAYTPMSGRLIHNGNLLAIESVLRLGGRAEDVRDAIQITVGAQRVDGSWPYGAGKDLAWVDNFHTAYVLDSLRFIGTMGLDYAEVLDKGTDYWLRNLFLESGEPRYYDTSSTPSKDIHNIATAVTTLSSLRRNGTDIGNRTESAKALMSFIGPDGAFRKKPKGPVFMRWNQAHATYALTKWMNAE